MCCFDLVFGRNHVGVGDCFRFSNGKLMVAHGGGGIVVGGVRIFNGSMRVTHQKQCHLWMVEGWYHGRFGVVGVDVLVWFVR